MRTDTVKTLKQFDAALNNSAAGKYIKKQTSAVKDSYITHHYYSVKSPHSSKKRTLFEFVENSSPDGGIIPEHQIVIACIPVLKRMVNKNGVKVGGDSDTIIRNNYSVAKFVKEITNIVEALEAEAHALTANKNEANKFTQYVLHLFSGVVLLNPKYLNLVRYATLDDLYQFFKHRIPERIIIALYSKECFNNSEHKIKLTAEECKQYIDVPPEWFEKLIKN
jgi:hypothetical protein